jgi:hypothetical protein
MRKMSWSVIATLFFMAFLQSCIVVVDRVNPFIQDFTLRENYNLLDTICVSTIFTDNEALKTIKINIEPLNTANKPGSTGLFSAERVIDLARGGRRYATNTCFPIPANAPAGTYNVRITATDRSDNKTITDKVITVLPDNVPPVVPVKLDIVLIKNNETINLVPDANGVYNVCQTDILDFAGTVVVGDNQAVKSVTVTLTVSRNNRDVNIFTNTTALNVTNQRQVALKGLFVPPVRIYEADVEGTPVQNGDALKLFVNVTDFSGNTTQSNSVNLRINCDRTLPVLRLQTTQPAFDSLSQQILVVEKGSFKITKGTMTDNNGLAKLNATFRRLNGSVVSSQDYALTGTSANLETFLTTPFNIPTAAQVNDEYELVLAVFDVAGNVSRYILKIRIKVDDPPLINLTKFTARLEGGIERDIQLSTVSTQPTLLPANTQAIAIDGKISDDNFLDYIRIIWSSDLTTTTPLINATPLTELVYDVTRPPLSNVFTLPTTSQPTTYKLEIRVKDNKVEVVRQYYVRTQ